MASKKSNKAVNKHNIDGIIETLQNLTKIYPTDDALKHSLLLYKNIKSNI